MAKGVVMLRSSGARARRDWRAMFGCGQSSERGEIDGVRGEGADGGGGCCGVGAG